MSRLPLVALLALSGTAFAQSDELPEAPSPRVIYKDVTELDIEGVTVEGVLTGPSIGLIQEPNRKGFAPMIHLRTDFNVEMTESVDLLK